MPNSVDQISIVGLGLIGGSIAKATRRYCAEVTILAWDTSPSARRAALREKVIDEAVRPPKLFDRSDIIFICVPLAKIPFYVKQAAAHAPRAIITDVGSVKGNLARELGNSAGGNVIWGHPMAGKETSGWASSDADLFRGRRWVLCPRPVNPSRRVARLKAFLRRLGARPLEMSLRDHDRRVAMCSHLPQLVATALAELAISKSATDDHLLAAAGPGFRDMTRLAESPFALWQDILSANPKEIEKALDDFMKLLLHYRKNLATQTMEKSFIRAAGLKRELQNFRR